MTWMTKKHSKVAEAMQNEKARGTGWCQRLELQRASSRLRVQVKEVEAVTEAEERSMKNETGGVRAESLETWPGP